MRITKWVCAVGAGSTLLVLTGLSAKGADAGNYFKIDGGVSLIQDVNIKALDNVKFPISTTAGDVADLLGIDLPNGVAAGTSVNVSKPKLSWDPGLRFDLVGGHKITESIAIELEVGVLYNSSDTLKVSGSANGTSFEENVNIDLNLWQVPFLVNGVYTFNLGPKFKPYIGVGAGGILTYITGDNVRSENDITFAYQGQAGIDYACTDNLSLGVAYKFLGTLDHKLGGVKTDEIFSHSILAALTIKF